MLDLEPAFGLRALSSFEVVSEVLEMLEILECNFLASPPVGQDCISRYVVSSELLHDVCRSIE